MLESSAPMAPFFSRRRKASTPPSPGFEDATNSSVKSEDITTSRSHSKSRSPLNSLIPDEASHIQLFRERVSSVGSGYQSWTVHVSLLPTSSQPFPFEKDTAAYKRCLSRGLHQMVVIPDKDSSSFKNAVNEAFSKQLRGRPWQPLVARLCDAKNLLGLPMLRQLPNWLIDSDYNADFLQRNCAVNDESGKILDLYIAMSEDTISWAELRNVTPYKAGLEAAWTHDDLLDGPFPEDSNNLDTSRPAAGDILPAWSPTLKRNASEISRTSSFGSSSEGEDRRAKMRRQGTGNVEVVQRRAEAV